MTGGHLFQAIICYACSRFLEPMTTGFEVGIDKRRKFRAGGGPAKIKSPQGEFSISRTFRTGIHG